MPNRIIKESITTSCEVDNLTPEEERLFYRLIVVCDDYGRMDARPPMLRAKCFPLKIDSVKDEDIEKWLTSLIKQQLIQIYIVENKPYLQMSTWEKHQQVRAKRSKFPAPDSNMIADDINCNQMQSNVPENPYPYPYPYPNLESESLSLYESMSPAPLQEIVELYNSLCKSLPKVKELTEKRKDKVRGIWKEKQDIELFSMLFTKAEESEFLSGRDGKWSNCGFDWLINKNNAIKVLEGNYDNKRASSNPPGWSNLKEWYEEGKKPDE